MDKNTPAFPVERTSIAEQYGSTGMTLRDYFAAKAMQALYASIYEYQFSGSPREPEFVLLMDELAGDSYVIADAMLKARK